MMKSLKHLQFTAFVLLVLGVLIACAPQGGGGGGGSAPAAPAPTTPTLEGTVSSGGGNGCDWKVIETYAKKLDDKEEYRTYIKPLLRRMSEQGNDVLATYLKWAAEEKAWFFVPCMLENLKQEHIGLAIRSDQLALHGVHNVYIFDLDKDHSKPSYSTGTLKVRAGLLLHEMVMGAKLLMKNTARVQCESLARRDTRICARKEFLEGLPDKKVDEKDLLTISALEHETIRGMTAYLRQAGADLSVGAIRSARKRLGFETPFDALFSELDAQGVAKAFVRSALLGDKHFTQPGLPYFQSEKTRCDLNFHQGYGDEMQISIGFVSKIAVTQENSDAFAQRLGRKPTIGIRAACENDISRGFDQLRRDGERPVCGTMFHNWDSHFGLSVPSHNIVTRGVIKNGVAYDEVLIGRPTHRYVSEIMSKEYEHVVIRALITRTGQPRVASVKIEVKQRLQDYLGEGDDSHNRSRNELLDIPGFPAIECVVEPKI